MPSRDLVINLETRHNDSGVRAAVEGQSAYEKALTKAEKAQAKQEAAVERAATKQRASMQEVGTGALAFGAAVTAGVGLAVKAAVEWESAWTGVTKTVEGTPAQLAQLEGALRGLARELPSTHKEIAAVAEAAGQLGIKRADIVGFTRTMIALGQTTNLSAEEAATALAKFSNIMGTSSKDVGKLGSALVALGNDGASTEKDIVDMALRIAGAGKTLNLTEGQVLGIASALSSVGIEAESGGSAISRVMISMATAVDAGGGQLEKFAKVAGMSSAEFARAFKEDAGGAVASFIGGLGKVEASGGSLFKVLADLGFSEVEVRDALMRTAAAGDLLSGSLRTGEQAWKSNTALAEEAAKRYGTTASQMQVAQNNITDLGITMGETFLPVLGDVARQMTGWMALLQDLPAPVKQAGAVVGGFTGLVALAGGAAMIAVPKMVEFRNTLSEMGPRGAAMARGLSSVGSVLMGPWGLAMAAAAGVLLLWGNAQAESAARVETFTRAIMEDRGAIAERTREVVMAQMVEDGLIAKAKDLGLNMDLVTQAFTGNKDSAAELRKQLDTLYDQKMDSAPFIAWPWDETGTKVKNQADAIATLRYELGDYTDKLGGATTKAGEHLDVQGKTTVKVDDLHSAMKGLTAEASGQGKAVGDLNGFMQTLASTYGLVGDDASKAAQQMLASWSGAFTQFFSLSGAMQAAEQAGARSSTASTDQRAAAQERLAEVQRVAAERIKSAQESLTQAHEQAADKIADAQARVAAAQEKVTEAAEQGAERVAAAEARVADGVQRVADVRADSARKIEEASQRVSDAEVAGAERVAAAEARLQDSHQRTAAAVDDLTAARERAIQRQEDLVRSAESGTLDEEGAEIAIQRARERIAELGAPDSKATALDRQEADLAYRRALARLEEIRRRNQETAQDIADYNQNGVEGSAEVIAAQERIRQAQEAGLEAEKAVAKAREEAAAQVADAQQALADAHADATARQSDAEKDLANLETELARTRIDGAKDVEKAKKDVAEAEKEAARANRDAARDITDAEAAVKEARADAARETLKANKEVQSSWTDLGGTVAVTTDQLLAQLDKQVRDQEDWAKNLISLAGRVPDEMLKELAELGPGGAKVVALASEMSDAELKKFIKLHGDSGKLAGDTFAQNLAEAGPVLRSIAKDRGQEVADKVREGMDGGRNSVAEAARRIGLDIDTGIGKNREVKVTIREDWYRTYYDKRQEIINSADGNILHFANGSERHVAQIATGPTRVWNEAETGGEAYIPLSPLKRQASEDILSQVAGVFGGVFLKQQGWPSGSMPVGRGGGGNNYSITVQVPPGGDMAQVGAVTVQAIQEYERRSGSTWRRSS